MKRLDLRKDFAEVVAFVAQRVKAFDPAANPGPGKGKRVSRIDVGFSIDYGGWVCLVFDTRRAPEPDGEWNEYIEETVLERPKWGKADDAVAAGPFTLVQPDGTRRELAAGDAGGLVTAIGDMLRAVLLQARDGGVFAALPKTPRCELGVEEQDGNYGWPDYELRGTDNRAEPDAAADPAGM
ncbi:MAG: hypothetical protein FJ304_23440 [Planctomycetes bacterium]|nr:hypothetical protein [Planctomycetota bacterium]